MRFIAGLGRGAAVFFGWAVAAVGVVGVMATWHGDQGWLMAAFIGAMFAGLSNLFTEAAKARVRPTVPLLVWGVLYPFVPMIPIFGVPLLIGLGTFWIAKVRRDLADPPAQEPETLPTQPVVTYGPQVSAVYRPPEYSQQRVPYPQQRTVYPVPQPVVHSSGVHPRPGYYQALISQAELNLIAELEQRAEANRRIREHETAYLERKHEVDNLKEMNAALNSERAEEAARLRELQDQLARSEAALQQTEAEQDDLLKKVAEVQGANALLDQEHSKKVARLQELQQLLVKSERESKRIKEERRRIIAKTKQSTPSAIAARRATSSPVLRPTRAPQVQSRQQARPQPMPVAQAGPAISLSTVSNAVPYIRKVGKTTVHGWPGLHLGESGEFTQDSVQLGMQGEHLVGSIVEKTAARFGGMVAHSVNFRPDFTNDSDMDHVVVGDNMLLLIDSKRLAYGDYTWSWDSKLLLNGEAPHWGGTIRILNSVDLWIRHCERLGLDVDVLGVVVLAQPEAHRYSFDDTGHPDGVTLTTIDGLPRIIEQAFVQTGVNPSDELILTVAQQTIFYRKAVGLGN